MPEFDDDRLDLSALDPTRDALRFQRIVRSIVSQAAMGRAPDASTVLTTWWRQALAVAAAAVVLAWAPMLLGYGGSTASPSSQPDPSTLLSMVRGEGPSSTLEVLETLGSVK